MKYFYHLFVLLLHTAIVVSGQVTSTKKTESNLTTITLGSSASIFSKFMSPLDKNLEIYRSQKTPPLNIAIDIKSNSILTVGFALFYEDYKYFKQDTNARLLLSRTNKLYSPQKSFSIPITSFSCINPSARILLHSNKNSNDFYFGLRLGYQLFLTDNNSQLIFGKKLNNLFTKQVIVGYRKYFDKWGANVEGCIGKPYWFLAGINYRIVGGSNE